MLNVDFSINPLTNRRQIAVNGAEERLSECCGSRDIPLEEWKGNCFEVMAKKYNDDVLSVSFTGMAKDFRFLSYLKNGAETEKKLQITLTGKTVYEPERLYRELGEAIREYDASEYDFLHEEYRKITGGMTEIVFLTPEAGWASDRLKPLLYDSEKKEYYAERKVTVVDAATADSLPEPEHALYYIHLCDLDGTAFKKSKQYLEKIRSLLESRIRRTLPDTFFLCEYDFESEEYEDLCDRIDSVMKENTIPLLAFNRESVSEEVKKTTETFFGDYVFGGCLLCYFTQINDSLSKPIRKSSADVEKLKEEIEAAEKELCDLKAQREALRKEKEQYREIPKILDRKSFEEQLIDYVNDRVEPDKFLSPKRCNQSKCAYCIHFHNDQEIFRSIFSDHFGWEKDNYFLEILRNFFLSRDYSVLRHFYDYLMSHHYGIEKKQIFVFSFENKNGEKISQKLLATGKKFVLNLQNISSNVIIDVPDIYNQWMNEERCNLFLKYERDMFNNDECKNVAYNLKKASKYNYYNIDCSPAKKVFNKVYPQLMADILSFLDYLEDFSLKVVAKQVVPEIEKKEKEVIYKESSLMQKIGAFQQKIEKNTIEINFWKSVLSNIKLYFVFME